MCIPLVHDAYVRAHEGIFYTPDTENYVIVCISFKEKFKNQYNTPPSRRIGGFCCGTVKGMPLKRSTTGGQPCYKWGDSGKCYPHTAGNAPSRERAKNKAKRQGRAIERSKHR